jgi:PAS domain S-box-containing protein
MTIRTFGRPVVFLTILVFVEDLVFPSDWLISRFYVPCILLLIREKSTWVPIKIAFASTLLTIVGFVAHSGGAMTLSFFTSRGLDILLFWITAACVARINRTLRMAARLTIDMEQKQAELHNEKALRLSESKYRTFVDHASDAVFVYDGRGVVLDVNRQTCESLGYTKDELVGQSPPFFSARIDPALFEDIMKRLHQGQMVAFESLHRHRNGTVFPVEVRICPFESDGQRLALAIARDITERKKAEDQLRASESRFRDLADAIPEIIWTATPDGALDHLNQRATEFTGVEIEGLKGWSWGAVIHPDDVTNTVAIWTEIVRSGIPQDMEFRIRKFDGEYRWHICREFASHATDGTITQWYGACTDIEDHKRIEIALRESEQRFLRFMQHLPGMGWIKDLQGRYVFANDALTRIASGTEGKLLGLNDIDIFEPETAIEYQANDRLALTSSQGIRVFETSKHPDGTTHVFLVSKFPIPGPDGQYNLIGGVAIDVTEQRAAELALRLEKDRFQTLAATAPGVICSLKQRTDGTFCFPYVSSQIVEVYGFHRDALADDGTPIFEMIHPDDRELVLRTIAESARTMKPWREVFRLRHPHVQTIWIETNAQPAREPDGSTLWHGFVTDVTNRKIAEEALRESDTRLRTIGLNLPDGAIYQYQRWPDNRKQYIYFTQGLDDRIGVTAREIVANVEALHSKIVPEDAAKLDILERYSLSSLASLVFEFRVRTSANQIRWLQCRSSPRSQPDGSAIWDGVTIDITDRKQIEAELQTNRQRLEVLSRQLITTQETERRLLACELHDEIGQQLTVIKMNLFRTQRTVDAAAHPELDDNIAMVDQVIGEVRNLSLSLRPPQLDELGLIAALHWLVKFQARSGEIEGVLDADVDGFPLTAELSTVCFRVVQEALTNSMRHGHPSRVHVQLRAKDSELHLVIEDDGAGFDVELARQRANAGASLGLLGMQERTSLVSGRLKIESVAGQGTKVEAWFPSFPSPSPSPSQN